MSPGAGILWLDEEIPFNFKFDPFIEFRTLLKFTASSLKSYAKYFPLSAPNPFELFI